MREFLPPIGEVLQHPVDATIATFQNAAGAALRGVFSGLGKGAMAVAKGVVHLPCIPS